MVRQVRYGSYRRRIIFSDTSIHDSSNQNWEFARNGLKLAESRKTCKRAEGAQVLTSISRDGEGSALY